MRGRRHQQKRFLGSVQRPDKRKRRQNTILACLSFALLAFLWYRSITVLITGEGMVWENYMYQPVGPGYVVVLTGALTVGEVVYLWHRYVKRDLDPQRENSKEERKRKRLEDRFWRYRKGPPL